MVLERDTELGLLDGFLDRVLSGKGGIVVLEGVPGIGKTVLLGETGERAAGREIGVLAARASQLDRGFPFGVARQLFERRVDSLSPAEREVLLAGAARDALPALGMAGEEAEGDPGLRSLHGLYWLAASLAGRGPLLLCIDDAHWADRSSLRWLAYTAPRLTGLPLGIAVATRPAEPGAEQDLLDAIRLDDATAPVEVGPLSKAAVGTLACASLKGPVAPEFEAACHHSTGGNPLLVRELLRDLAAEGAKPSVQRAATLGDFGVEAVARNVRRRLHALGPQAEAVARAVAVVGNGATVAEVAATCDLGEDAVRAAAAGLATTDLLLAATPLAFVHPLVRAAVYEDMAAVEREALHRRVASLREGRAEPEQVAVHLLRVEPRSDPEAIGTLRAAAACALERGAPDAAATFLGRALAEPPEAGEPRAQVLRELGLAEMLARMDGFEPHLRASIAELADPEQAAAVALVLAGGLGVLGDGAGAVAVLEEALAACETGGTTASQLEAELLAVTYGYPELRSHAAGRVRELLGQVDRGEPLDPTLLGALSLWMMRDHAPAGRAVQAAEAALADPRLQQGAPSATFRLLCAYTLLAAGQAKRAAGTCDEVLATARQRGELPILGTASTVESECLFRLGEVAGAEEAARRAWDNAVGEGLAMEATPVGLVFAGGTLVNALVARGKLEEAEGLFSHMPDPLPERSEMLLPARAELRLAQGRTGEAIADLRATGVLLGGEFVKLVQNWRARLAVALARAGEREEARELAAAELEQARRWQVPLATGVALAAAGVAEGGKRGVALLEEAVTTLEQTEGRLDHALALIELGALLRRSGSRAAAREPLRLGIDLAARCGASLHADRAHAELVAAGARPRRDRRFLTGPESLTAGELRVASLAAEGLTDREIAQRLYVTQSAVQFHLRNTFRKLEIGARGEIAASLAPGASEAKDW